MHSNPSFAPYSLSDYYYAGAPWQLSCSASYLSLPSSVPSLFLALWVLSAMNSWSRQNTLASWVVRWTAPLRNSFVVRSRVDSDRVLDLILFLSFGFHLLWQLMIAYPLIFCIVIIWSAARAESVRHNASIDRNRFNFAGLVTVAWIPKMSDYDVVTWRHHIGLPNAKCHFKSAISCVSAFQLIDVELLLWNRSLNWDSLNL